MFSFPFLFVVCFCFFDFVTSCLLCLPHLLGLRVASFSVRTLITALSCTSHPSSCPARALNTALRPVGLWRARVLLPAPLSPRRATRSKVCAPLLSSLFSPLVSFSKKHDHVASPFKCESKTCEDYLESPLS